ncbi:MAG TPA: glycine cleavage system protein GcvH [Geminicoccaceae bacterium]|nr:glycine cleavage system protein GcvH [Geminicoccaceae bacterium]
MTTRYTKDHEWVRVEGDTATVGISDHAQEQLGDVVFVELPEIGREVAQGDQTAVVESVKAASDIYAPVSGEVIGRNEELESNPALVNEDPEAGAWFFKLRLADPAELDELMDRQAYEAFLDSLG